MKKLPSISGFIIAIMALCCPLLKADDKKAPTEKGKAAAPDNEKGGTKKADAAVEQTTSGLTNFGKVLPLGQKNKEVNIPSFTDGRPTSIMNAKTMTRMDEENMFMERMDIRMFGETRDQDLHVELRTGNYHMQSQVLSSQQRSRVSRADFELEGDTMVFDTRTQQGKMTGHVEMTIFDSRTIMGNQSGEAAEAKNQTKPEENSKIEEPSKVEEPKVKSPEAGDNKQK